MEDIVGANYRYLKCLSVLLFASLFEVCDGRDKIAVCVTGQVGRLIPDYFVDGLILANPNYDFHLLFYLYQSPAIYTTKHIIEDTIYQNMTGAEIRMSLHGMFALPNSVVEGVFLNRLLSKSEWKQRTNLGSFDLFQQFKKMGHVMLNMYQHHEDCAIQIDAIEMQRGIKFAYIISTREDLYFFKPLSLNYLIERYIMSNSCELLTKGCLDFGGLNMRLQVIDARNNSKSSYYLRKVSRFIEFIRDKKGPFLNPERFEQYLAEDVNKWKVCKISVEEYPVTAARLSYVNRSVCFVHQELKQFGGSDPPCVPQDAMDFAIMHLCPKVSTRYEFIPWQTFAFVPNSAFPMPPSSNRHSTDYEINVINK